MDPITAVLLVATVLVAVGVLARMVKHESLKKVLAAGAAAVAVFVVAYGVEVSMNVLIAAISGFGVWLAIPLTFAVIIAGCTLEVILSYVSVACGLVAWTEFRGWRDTRSSAVVLS